MAIVGDLRSDEWGRRAGAHVLVVKVDVVVLVDFAIAVHAVLFCSTDSLKRKCSVKLVTANAARECTTFLLFRRWGFDLPESAGGN
jgi:hypothetical protein